MRKQKIYTRSYNPPETPLATGQLLARIHQTLGMGPMDQQG